MIKILNAEDTIHPLVMKTTIAEGAEMIETIAPLDVTIIEDMTTIDENDSNTYYNPSLFLSSPLFFNAFKSEHPPMNSPFM